MTENSSTARRDEIINNLSNVRRRIGLAARNAGRDPREITLVAVTKTMPAEDVNTAIDAGVTVFGENRVQELMDKQPLLHPCEAHFIGTLQKNKVKYLIDRVSLIESVGSYDVLFEIEKRAAKAGKTVNVLLEVNVGGEEQKSGFSVGELDNALEYARTLSHVFVKGLMTVPPVSDDPEDSAPYFEKMRQLFIDKRDKKEDNISMDILSMGMSRDFETAIRYGATHVRVGTGIFGARNYDQKQQDDKTTVFESSQTEG